MGKHPPLDAAADEIEDGVEDFAPVDGLRPPSRFGLGNQGLDQLPLGIGQIGGVFLRVSYPFLRPKQGVRFTFHTGSKMESQDVVNSDLATDDMNVLSHRN